MTATNGNGMPTRYALNITCTRRQVSNRQYSFNTRVVAVDASDAREFGYSFAETRLANMGEVPNNFMITVVVREPVGGSPRARPGSDLPLEERRSVVTRLIEFFRGK